MARARRIPSLSDPDFVGRCEENRFAQVIVIGEQPRFFCALEHWTVVGSSLDREIKPVLENNAKGVTPHINRAHPLANQLNREFVTSTSKPRPWMTVLVMKSISDTTAPRGHPLTRSPNRNDQPLRAQSQTEKARSTHSVSTNVGTNLLDRSSDHLLCGYWWWYERPQAARRAPWRVVRDRLIKIRYVVVIDDTAMFRSQRPPQSSPTTAKGVGRVKTPARAANSSPHS